MKFWQVFSVLLLFFLPSQLGRHFWPNYSNIYGLRIDYLSPTFYLTDIFLVLSISTWLKENLRLKKGNLKTLLGWSPALIIVFLNVFLAKNQMLAFFKSLKVIELLFLVFLVVKEKKFFLRAVGLIFPWIIIIQFLLCLFQFTKGGSFGRIFWYLGERTFSLSTPGIAKMNLAGRVLLRPYGTFSHPNSLAGFILIALVLIIWKKDKDLIDYLSVVLGCFILLTSFSRTVWLVSMILLLVVFSFWVIKNLKSQKYSLSFWIKISLGLAIFFICFNLVKSTLETETISRRVEINQVAISLIKNNVFFGVGLNNFIPQAANYLSLRGGSFWLQPVHNLYLLILTETGVFGLLICLSINICFFKKIIEEKNLKMFIVLTAVLLTGLTDHYWFTLQQNFLLLGIVYGLGF